VNGYTAVFQNGADNIGLNFNTVANYTNGVSVTKTNGLKITGYSPYQVIVKTSSANLTSTTGEQQYDTRIGRKSRNNQKHFHRLGYLCVHEAVVECSTRSSLPIRLTDYTQQVVQYNLRYYTIAGDKKLNAALPELIHTSVLFVVIPQ
jgi:hypothetical protein